MLYQASDNRACDRVASQEEFNIARMLDQKMKNPISR